MTRVLSRFGKAAPLGLVALLVARTVSTQEPPPASFPSGATAITVDVVVLDAQDRPVRGLTRADFTVLEDGHPQRVVGFEARDLEREAARGSEQAAAASGESAAPSSVDRAGGVASGPARILALLVDDLGISAPVMTQVKPALARWIEEEADPRDEITITTTSGDIWWSDDVARGRQDLLTVLRRIAGRRETASSQEPMSDREAYQIAVLESPTEAIAEGSARSRPPDAFALPAGGVKLVGSSAMERVTQRWLESHECAPCPVPPSDLSRAGISPADCFSINECRRRVRARAQELHEKWLRRGETVFASVARLSRSLADAPGRKSILLVTEALLEDQSLQVPLRDAVDAAQRGNTALYFLDARGLAGISLFSAEARAPERAQDLGIMGTEETTLVTAGGEELAEQTGGAMIAATNDLAAGLERIASDSSAYYLLGYQPEEPPDGKWHKLEVKVARPHTKVLARKGYLASRSKTRLATAEAERKQDDAKGKGTLSKRPLSPALLTGGARDGIPLRLAAYVKDTNGFGMARVQIALEIDNSQVHVDRTTTPWKASLDMTVMAASPFRPPAVPIDERMDLSLRPGDVGSGWWLVPRELWLPPGLVQLRVFVRDRGTGESGRATQRLVVPDVDQPYLSTPVISDRTLPPVRQGAPPRLLASAQREFDKKRPLFCQFEVYTFGGQDLRGVPRLNAGFVLQKADGQQVGAGPSTLIKTEGHYAARRIALPVEDLDDGPYVLVLTVQDELAHRTLVARAPFVVSSDAESPPAAPNAKP
jgi:VWFA-related protein